MVIGLILVVLMATNPSIDDHREAIKKAVFSSIENASNTNNENSNNYGNKIGQSMGESIGSAFIDNIVVRQNLFLFSFGSMEFEGKSQNQITLGILGHIFLLKEYDLNTNSFVNSEGESIPLIDNKKNKIEKKNIEPQKDSIDYSYIPTNIVKEAKSISPNIHFKIETKSLRDVGELYRIINIDNGTILFDWEVGDMEYGDH